MFYAIVNYKGIIKSIRDLVFINSFELPDILHESQVKLLKQCERTHIISHTTHIMTNQYIPLLFFKCNFYSFFINISSSAFPTIPPNTASSVPLFNNYFIIEHIFFILIPHLYEFPDSDSMQLLSITPALNNIPSLHAHFHNII